MLRLTFTGIHLVLWMLSMLWLFLKRPKSSESNRLISITDLMSTESLALNREKLLIKSKDESITMLTLKIRLVWLVEIPLREVSVL